MKASINNELWNITCNVNPDYMTLPQQPAVYIFYIKLKDSQKRIITYVGVTKHLRYRIMSHDVLRLLRYNKNNYDIYLLFKHFGNRYSDRQMEYELIKRHKPIFNVSGLGKRNNSKIVAEFWNSIGVSSVIYRLRKNRNRKKLI